MEMNNEVVSRVYKEVSTTLSLLAKKQKAVRFFQKIMWLITGTFFVLLLINMSSIYTGSVGVPFLNHIIHNDSPYYIYKDMLPFVMLIILLYPSIYLFAFFFKKIKQVETSTISKMVKTLFPEAEFAQGAQLSTNEIVQSTFFSWFGINDVAYTYGQMRKKIGSIHLNIADIGLTEDNVSSKLMKTLMGIPGLNIIVILYQYVLKNILSNKSADNLYFTFRGLYAWAKFNKKLNGRTIILSNNIGDKLDRFTSLNFKDEEKVMLEDARFASEFVVYSTDQVEARYVLSISVMEKIMALKDKFDRPIMLSFTNKNIYIAVNNPNGIFSFPSGKIDSIDTINELFNEISTIQDIVEDFNLNYSRKPL